MEQSKIQYCFKGQSDDLKLNLKFLGALLKLMVKWLKFKETRRFFKETRI